jgi:hypothetical protein
MLEILDQCTILPKGDHCVALQNKKKKKGEDEGFSHGMGYALSTDNRQAACSSSATAFTSPLRTHATRTSFGGKASSRSWAPRAFSIIFLSLSRSSSSPLLCFCHQ